MSDLSLESLRAIGSELGYKESSLASFIKEQQDKARDEREKAREERAKEREHELAVLQLRVQAGTESSEQSEASSSCQLQNNSVKLPYFNDGEDISAYLMRFERLAVLMNIKPEHYAIHLGSLLKGKALKIYSTLNPATTSNFNLLKDALLKAFKQTPDHYRKQFRRARISNDETYTQFSANLGVLLDYWLESSKVEQTYESLREFILCDQFLSSCSSELRIFVKERKCSSVAHMADTADIHATARNSYPKVTQKVDKYFSKDNKTDDKFKENKKVPISQIKCHGCGVLGHTKKFCPQNPVLLSTKVKNNSVNITLSEPNLLGRPISGTVNGIFVTSILRDTGCSLIIVSSDLLSEVSPKHDKFTSISDYLGRKDKFPLVQCYIDCAYFTGWTLVARAPIKHASVLIGNIKGLKPLQGNDEHHDCKDIVQAVQTRAGKSKVFHPLFVPEIDALNVNYDEFKKLQSSCPSLKSIRDNINGKPYQTRGGAKFVFEIQGDLLYRRCVDSSRPLELDKLTLVVPMHCRNLILKLAHDSPIAGHFSHRKTAAKVFDKFYWPGATGDIQRYCKSCDICQRTAAKGRIRKVPMQQLPIVTVPFERIAIDIIGPISPPSIEGHKYVLTVIDYGTKFPEAIPLRNIDTISVAESLVNVFSRVGIPREVLSDRGAQFTSALMGEINRLLGIKPLFTTPYHAQANGACERMNGIIKSVLKKLCHDHPRDWNRYLPSTLFAIREIPNDSLKFSPFELLYGRRVRGPLTLLHELWTNSSIEPELRNSYEYVFNLRQKLEETAALAAQNCKISSDRYKTYFDKTAKK